MGYVYIKKTVKQEIKNMVKRHAQKTCKIENENGECVKETTTRS